MVSILFIVFAAGLVAVIIVLFLRRRNPARLTWGEVGTLIDRSLRAYRRQFVPLLALSAICAPLGVVTYTSIYSFFLDAPALSFALESDGWLRALRRVVTMGVFVMGTLGLGRTLLACGAAQALRVESEVQGVEMYLARGILPIQNGDQLRGCVNQRHSRVRYSTVLSGLVLRLP